MFPVAVPETVPLRSTPFNGCSPLFGSAESTTDKVGGGGVGVAVGLGVAVAATGVGVAGTGGAVGAPDTFT